MFPGVKEVGKQKEYIMKERRRRQIFKLEYTKEAAAVSMELQKSTTAAAENIINLL